MSQSTKIEIATTIATYAAVAAALAASAEQSWTNVAMSAGICIAGGTTIAYTIWKRVLITERREQAARLVTERDALQDEARSKGITP